MTWSVEQLDALPEERAAEALRACCGASNWVAGMLGRRPFHARQALLEAADDVWAELESNDWLEAFTHHPRIGEQHAALATVAREARTWSAAEQSGAAAAAEDVATALAEGNRAYEARFGFIFLICATGLSADTMLATLQRRLRNDAESELRVAAEEQRKITRLRLEKLLTPTMADARSP